MGRLVQKNFEDFDILRRAITAARLETNNNI
jgi:hypothetical protein